MDVKWVCNTCGTNNLGKNGPFMQCIVCGKLRTTEPVTRVDKKFVNTDRISRSEAKHMRGRKHGMELAAYVGICCSRCAVYLAKALLLIGVILTLAAMLDSAVSVPVFLRRVLSHFKQLFAGRRFLFPLVQGGTILSVHIRHFDIAMITEHLGLIFAHFMYDLEYLVPNVKHSLIIWLQPMNHITGNLAILLDHILTTIRCLPGNLQHFWQLGFEKILDIPNLILSKAGMT